MCYFLRLDRTLQDIIDKLLPQVKEGGKLNSNLHGPFGSSLFLAVILLERIYNKMNMILWQKIRRMKTSSMLAET